MVLIGRWAGTIAVLAAVAAAPSVTRSAEPDVTAMTCTNTASGASWQIRINYQKRTVDSNPAEITDSAISWHDPSDGGNYTLDRKSGDLTVVVASATGGYFLHHHCGPAH